MVEESDIVIFSVKPQVVKDVVLQLRPLLSKKKLLVSIPAGVKLKDLQGILGFIKLFQSKKRVVEILRDMSGIVKPSRYLD